MASKSGDSGKREYHRHGLTRAKRAISEYGSRSIDMRTKAGRALTEWTDAIVRDLGGEQAISAQQATLIELCSRTKLLLDGVDAWLLSQGRPPVNKKSQRLWPVVRERTALSDSLARYLGQLGLEKHRPDGQDLTTYVEEHYGGKDGDTDSKDGE